MLQGRSRSVSSKQPGTYHTTSLPERLGQCLRQRVFHELPYRIAVQRRAQRGLDSEQRLLVIRHGNGSAPHWGMPVMMIIMMMMMMMMMIRVKVQTCRGGRSAAARRPAVVQLQN